MTIDESILNIETTLNNLKKYWDEYKSKKGDYSYLVLQMSNCAIDLSSYSNHLENQLEEYLDYHCD